MYICPLDTTVSCCGIYSYSKRIDLPNWNKSELRVNTCLIFFLLMLYLRGCSVQQIVIFSNFLCPPKLFCGVSIKYSMKFLNTINWGEDINLVLISRRTGFEKLWIFVMRILKKINLSNTHIVGWSKISKISKMYI